MLRFKQISGSGLELEQAVNVWLNEFEPDIRQMSQTSGPDGNVTMSFLFTESFVGQELRLDAEHGISAQQMPSIPEDAIPSDPIQVPGQTDPFAATTEQQPG